MIRILAPMGSRSFFGAERANIDLLWRMQQKGAAVHCLVRHEEWRENLVVREALSSRDLEWQKASFPDYPSTRYWQYWPRVAVETPARYMALNRLALRKIKEDRITHIHLHNPFQAASFYSAIEKSDVAVIYRCGDTPTRHNAFYRYIWAWMSRRAALFVTESEFVRNQLISFGVDARKTQLIRTPAPRRTTSKKIASPPLISRASGLTFVYVGQFAEHKGIRLLLEAFSIVIASEGTARLLVAAPIEDAYARDVVHDWAYATTQGTIHFLGAVEDVPGLLAVCDVHVAPTLKPEPYGLVAVEAKEAGLPSIVFNEGGLGELVVDGQEGISLAEKTASTLADAMLTYCRDLLRVKADGVRARASLRARLLIDRHDDDWCDVYTRTTPY